MTKNKVVILDKENQLNEEKKRRKYLRLLQVREQAKQNEARKREAFKKEKNRQIQDLKAKQEKEYLKNKEEKIEELQDMVNHKMRHFGEGHQLAEKYEDKTDEYQQIAIENENKATERGQQALKTHFNLKIIKENKENAPIIARQFALEQERIRAAEIAKLPAPKNDELKKIDDKKSVKLVCYHDANAFMTTRYHMPETTVDKTSDNRNAQKDAEEEAIRLEQMKQEKERTDQERLERARLRGKHALEKEVLHEHYNDFLGELSLLQKVDRERRQKELLNIPKEIFLPPWQRQQEKYEKQHDLEREFEKIYINAQSSTDSLPSIPQSLEMKINQNDLSSNVDSSELDLTLIENKENEVLENCELKEHLPTAEPVKINLQSESLPKKNQSQTNSQNLSTADRSKFNDAALKALRDRVQKQREAVQKKQEIVDVTNSSLNSTLKQQEEFRKFSVNKIIEFLLNISF